MAKKKKLSLVQSLSVALCKHSVPHELKEILPKGRSFIDAISYLTQSK